MTPADLSDESRSLSDASGARPMVRSLRETRSPRARAWTPKKGRLVSDALMMTSWAGGSVRRSPPRFSLCYKICSTWSIFQGFPVAARLFGVMVAKQIQKGTRSLISPTRLKFLHAAASGWQGNNPPRTGVPSEFLTKPYRRRFKVERLGLCSGAGLTGFSTERRSQLPQTVIRLPKGQPLPAKSARESVLFARHSLWGPT